MKKYSSVFAGDTIKASDLSSSFSGRNYTIKLNRDIDFVWFYTVPKNTILKILNYKIIYSFTIIIKYSEVYNPTGKVSTGTEQRSFTVLNDSYYIRDINGNIFRLDSNDNVYLNDGMSLGFHISYNTFSNKVSGATGDYTLTITDISFDMLSLPQIQIFGMIEYDSVSAEIEEKLNSLSSRVALLESKINS